MGANEFTVRMAESFEKAARAERADKAKAAELWTKAGDGFLEANMPARACECFGRGGVLNVRATTMATSGRVEDSLPLLEGQQLMSSAALARLHLMSAGRQAAGYSAGMACLIAAEDESEAGVRVGLVTGAMLAAAWTDDMGALAMAADAALLRSAEWTTPLVAKIVATGDFELLGELETRMSARKSVRIGPGHLRLMAPTHAWRGIALAPLIDALEAFPATRRIAQEYRALVAGLESGDPDAALTTFINGIKLHTVSIQEGPPIRSWDDVRTRFEACFVAQPEAITAAILWDQVWAARAGVREVAELLTDAHRDSRTAQWTLVFDKVEALLGNRVFSYLAQARQIEVYRLGCLGAIGAENWDRYDTWALILEGRYGIKGVLRNVLSAIET